MNTVVNKLGFDNGKMRLKSAYRRQKVWAIYFTHFCLLSCHEFQTALNTNKKHNKKTQSVSDCVFLKTGTPTGNRTPVTAVKGRCPNR